MGASSMSKSLKRCDADWGSATSSQRCTLRDGHDGTHIDGDGRWSPAEEQTSARVSSGPGVVPSRSEEHTSELQSPDHLVCRLLLEKKKTDITHDHSDVRRLDIEQHTIEAEGMSTLLIWKRESHSGEPHDHASPMCLMGH